VVEGAWGEGVLEKNFEIMSKQLIKEWGENTAYAAKSHFKMADFHKTWIYCLIVVNILFAIFSLLNLGAEKVFSILSLVASILLIVHEHQSHNKSNSTHMQIGDDYLSIHYELQKLFHQEEIEKSDIEKVSKRMEKLRKMPKPTINRIGKYMADKAIDKKGEMINWWKDE
jgi:uncharacterized membrane-anchored protein YitT (DUF2179 family)